MNKLVINSLLFLLSAFGLSFPFWMYYIRDNYAQNIINQCNTTVGVVSLQYCETVAPYNRPPVSLVFDCESYMCKGTVYYFNAPYYNINDCGTLINFYTETMDPYEITLKLYFDQLPSYDPSFISVIYNRQNPNISSVYYTGVMSDHEFNVYQMLKLPLYVSYLVFIITFVCDIAWCCGCSKKRPEIRQEEGGNELSVPIIVN